MARLFRLWPRPSPWNVFIVVSIPCSFKCTETLTRTWIRSYVTYIFFSLSLSLSCIEKAKRMMRRMAVASDNNSIICVRHIHWLIQRMTHAHAFFFFVFSFFGSSFSARDPSFAASHWEKPNNGSFSVRQSHTNPPSFLTVGKPQCPITPLRTFHSCVDCGWIKSHTHTHNNSTRNAVIA